MEEEIDSKLIDNIKYYYKMLKEKNPNHKSLRYVEIEAGSFGILYGFREKFGTLEKYLDELKNTVG